ncbi:MAG: amino acid ABC transporter substrate-binding protein [Chloroflexi bacterium]|nr:amino acid ABC transporter substrate-binding protein [Chloroflexota bacterium]
MKKQLVLVIGLALLVLVLVACDSREEIVEVTRIVEVTIESESVLPESETTTIFERVQERGRLLCGGRSDNLPGYNSVDQDGKHVGFDVDLCRAVAAAILGDATAVDFIPLESAQRGPALINREIDLLARTATWTSSRDVQWGDFTITMFYDGQGFMVRRDSGITLLAELDGATICVNAGSTHESNLVNTFRERGLDFTPITFRDRTNALESYRQGQCDAYTGDRASLLGLRNELAPDSDDHIILAETISKEPLTPAVPSGDEQWFDTVKIVMYVLINAEELGVTLENVDEMLNSDNIAIRRLLGVEQTFGQEELGLDLDFAVDILQAVGNYGEIYDRHFGPETDLALPRGLNNLWINGGLIYAPPLK